MNKQIDELDYIWVVSYLANLNDLKRAITEEGVSNKILEKLIFKEIKKDNEVSFFVGIPKSTNVKLMNKIINIIFNNN